MSFIRPSSSPNSVCGWQEDALAGAIRRGHHCHFHPQNSTWWGFFILNWDSMQGAATFCMWIGLFFYLSWLGG